MPVIVPARPVMAAKTSLFHVCKSARCAISMVSFCNVLSLGAAVLSSYEENAKWLSKIFEQTLG